MESYWLVEKKNKKSWKNEWTYLLVAFPFLGTFLDDSIGIDFYDVDQLGNFGSLGMYMIDSSVPTVWKMICNLRKWERKNVQNKLKFEQKMCNVFHLDIYLWKISCNPSN